MKSAKEWVKETRIDVVRGDDIVWSGSKLTADIVRAIQADARESLLEELWAAHYLTSESFKLLRDDEARKLKDTVGEEKEPGT